MRRKIKGYVGSRRITEEKNIELRALTVRGVGVCWPPEFVQAGHRVARKGCPRVLHERHGGPLDRPWRTAAGNHAPQQHNIFGVRRAQPREGTVRGEEAAEAVAPDGYAVQCSSTVDEREKEREGAKTKQGSEQRKADLSACWDELTTTRDKRS